MAQKISEIGKQIADLQQRLNNIEIERKSLLSELKILESLKNSLTADKSPELSLELSAQITKTSSGDDKISLFRSLFRGRTDVFPQRFESRKTGKSGYQPACSNEWVRGICNKPRIKCSNCEHRNFIPLSNEIIRNHLTGTDSRNRDFCIGVYPLLENDNCWFLALDFDNKEWQTDVQAFIASCDNFNIPAYIERSRSGKGAHIWIFFAEEVPAFQARKLGAALITATMEQRPELGFKSYDRLFPSQDTLPKGGFGNLIALPLQKKPRESGNTIFIDNDLNPYPDQWLFLDSIRRLSRNNISDILANSLQYTNVTGVKAVTIEEEDKTPWLAPPSGTIDLPPIKELLPSEVHIILGNQIYLAKKELPPVLRNRIVRIAAFQNPEFYKAQAMRLTVYNKPRIISCCEEFPEHIGMPRGCLDEILCLLKFYNIKPILKDERNAGNKISLKFQGKLRPEQKIASSSLIQYDIGVLSANTAFGKTVVALNLIAWRKTNTLILVHRRQLLDQWVSRLTNFLNIEKNQIGQIGGGKHKPTGIIDVAIIQSLNKKGIVDNIVAEYGFLIVDECHHVSAYSFEQVARRCKAKFITGLSATPMRKDGHHPIIFMQCGPIRYQTNEKAQTESRPFSHQVIVHKTNFKMDIRNDTNISINDIYSRLINDEQRNYQITDDIIGAVDSGRTPIVLTERREHLDFFSEVLSKHIKNTIVFKGGMGKKQRQQTLYFLNSIPNNEQRVILSTGRYLGEGFDDARLDTLFLTLPVSWKGVIVQYAGRLHRLHDLKEEVVIHDYYDAEIPMLNRMYQRRCSGYKTIGYELVPSS